MGRHLEDVFTGVPTSSRRHFWRRHQWRQPGLGESFSPPVEAEAQDGGPSAAGRHLGTRNEVIQDGNRKRKSRHLAPPPQWGRKTLPILLMVNSLRPSDAYICVSKLTIIGSDNGLSPDRRQAIIWTNAGLSLLIGPLGTNFSEILIEILTF